MKKEQILMILTPVLLLFLFALGYIKTINSKSDEIKFKTEYEALNNKYYKVKISKDNNIKYSSYREIFKLLDSGTGIIYLGYKEDNNSRYAIEILIKVLKENKYTDNVYYLDIHNDRDSYVVEDDKLVYELDDTGKEIKGTKNYLKLVQKLKNHLLDYMISLNDKTYSNGIKRIYFPSIIFVKSGQVLGIENIYEDMEYDEVYNIFDSYVSNINSSTCDVEKSEPC